MTPLFKKIKQVYRHKKEIKEEMEGVHDNAGEFMYLNVKTNS